MPGRPRRPPRRADARSPAPVRRQTSPRRPRRTERGRVTPVSRGRPSVSVPVLSTTSVSTVSRRSSASAFLMSTPAEAPRPVPTMMAMGVASPSAHGHAMISTAMALSRASAKRGSGPQTYQPTNGRDGHDDYRRHEPARHRIGEPLDGRPRPLRLAYHPDNLREHGIAPDALRTHDEASRPVDGRAGDSAVQAP